MKEYQIYKKFRLLTREEKQKEKQYGRESEKRYDYEELLAWFEYEGFNKRADRIRRGLEITFELMQEPLTRKAYRKRAALFAQVIQELGGWKQSSSYVQYVAIESYVKYKVLLERAMATAGLEGNQQDERV